MRLTKKKIRQMNVATHRDLGYFFSVLIIIYCLSGIALNHINDWDPDFIITRQNVAMHRSYDKQEVSKALIDQWGKLVGEDSYKVYDFPTNDQVKIYYDNASLHIHLHDQKAVYERVSRRPVFYHANVLHRNSLKGWKWASDVFAVMLITISITGLFVLKGKHGITGRGKWWIAAGLLPPVIAVIIYELMN